MATRKIDPFEYVNTHSAGRGCVAGAPMSDLFTCTECLAAVATSQPGIGHHDDCPNNTDDGDEDAARVWLESRPPHIRAVFERFPATRLYRLHGNVVFILAYDDSGEACRVGISHDFNVALVFDREVFGVPFTDLTPVDETPEAIRTAVAMARGES